MLLATLPQRLATQCVAVIPYVFANVRLGFSRAVILVFVSGTATHAAALSLGRVSAAPVLNAPLAATVPVALSSDESLDIECVRVEVFVGEDRLAPNLVRAELAGSGTQRQIRVRTTARLVEPIVSIFVEAGCQSRVSRRYTLLVDPLSPQGTEPAPLPVQPPAQAEPILPIQPAPAARGAANATPRSVVRRGDAGNYTTRPANADAAQATPARPLARKPAPKPARALVPEVKPKLTIDIATEFAEGSTFQLARELAASTQQAVDDARRAELRVLRDALVAELEGKAEPGSLARKIAELEQSNQALAAQLNTAKAQAATEKAVREMLERERYSPWVVYALVAALLAVLAAFAWFALRRRIDRSLSSPFSADEPPPGQDAPYTADVAEAAPQSVRRSDVIEQAIEDGFVDPDTLIRPGKPGGAFVNTQPQLRAAQPRASLSVSELVAVSEVADISQEAEFFIEIGEYQRAIDLLEQHIGPEYEITPVPQLYLFDLYRRTGKRAEYETLHAEFTRKYNAHVPRWADDPALNQRELLDYERALEHICRVWPGTDVTYELETLLVDDTDGQRLGFDLPAYRDIIFLYGIAKQLSLDDEEFDVGLPASGVSVQSHGGDTVDFELPEASAEVGSAYDRALAIDLDFDAFAKGAPAGKPGDKS
jgi:hypothetical protein